VSSHLPAYKPKDVLHALAAADFFVDHISGSHYILKHKERTGLRITLPWHGKDIKRRA
jgi:predicted RNA binding protein YcfA (HicA-like mRNA interferase family)